MRCSPLFLYFLNHLNCFLVICNELDLLSVIYLSSSSSKPVDSLVLVCKVKIQ